MEAKSDSKKYLKTFDCLVKLFTICIRELKVTQIRGNSV